ncbi:DEAD/DEAH box helicase [Brevibacillus laterosporus]|uniref:DEAD/DEAH box helicase n=1 Tax=Brevibacillus laterosporus TaxID=1465 RepID=UPI000BC41855|nr:DEAD/DEAH box helicase [Brevibacillus laterosporus]PCN45276.1 DEAD/DEAH box helicase [Brevibacillus laterosporus]
MPKFQSLGIQASIEKALQQNGLHSPTEIQEKGIPTVLTGVDVIAQAQTGTGKTLAFVLPILQMINPENPDVQALIVTPTRELALQITAEVNKLIFTQPGVQVLAIYGGQDVERQMKKLRGSRQIVIATPGRLLDHMRRGTIQLAQVSQLVLDEADQMLHLGFLPEVEEIIQATSPTRQTLLFSATMPKQIQSLAKGFMRQPVTIKAKSEGITVANIEQRVIETTDRAKQAALRQAIDECRPFLAVIFCRTKRRAATLNEALQGFGYASDELHGDLSQAKREQVMKRFREASLQFLVATDVAARGLDVEGVTHVFNYDIPHDVESYIHRIGRTGRAGGTGVAITFVAPKDRMYLDMIEKGIGQSLTKEAYGNSFSQASSNEEPARHTADKRAGQSENRRQSKARDGNRAKATGSKAGSKSSARSGQAKHNQTRPGQKTGVKQGTRTQNKPSSRSGTRQETKSGAKRSGGTAPTKSKAKSSRSAGQGRSAFSKKRTRTK